MTSNSKKKGTYPEDGEEGDPMPLPVKEGDYIQESMGPPPKLPPFPHTEEDSPLPTPLPVEESKEQTEAELLVLREMEHEALRVQADKEQEDMLV